MSDKSQTEPIHTQEVTFKPTRKDNINVLQDIYAASSKNQQQFLRDGLARMYGKEGYNTHYAFNLFGEGSVQTDSAKWLEDAKHELAGYANKSEAPKEKAFFEMAQSGLEYFIKFTTQFRGGGPDSVPPDGVDKETETIDIAGEEVKKYARYFDYAPDRFPNDYMTNDRPRNTEVNPAIGEALNKRKAELSQKIKDETITDDELPEAFALIYLTDWAQKTLWTKKGKIINRQELS